MTVYIEYAFLENFLYDYVLLRLAFFASREKTKWYRLVLSAIFGAVFTLAYPFIRLPSVLYFLLKIGLGLMLCTLAFGRLKTKKEWGRYAFTVISFFSLTFGYGGAMLLFLEDTTLTPMVIFIGFAVLSAVFTLFIQKLYQKRTLHAFIYPCTLTFGLNRIVALGYYDSGNRAEKNGVPICFLSPELVYELFGEEILKGGGTVRDETEIITLSGGKKAPVYKGGLEVEISRGKTEKNTVYFSPSKNMISREYKVLLNAAVLGG